MRRSARPLEAVTVPAILVCDCADGMLVAAGVAPHTLRLRREVCEHERLIGRVNPHTSEGREGY